MHRNSTRDKFINHTIFSVEANIPSANIFSTQQTTPNQPQDYGAQWSPPANLPSPIPHTLMTTQASNSYGLRAHDYPSMALPRPPFPHTTLTNSKHYSIFNTFDNLSFLT